jgi:hypothetical protein
MFTSISNYGNNIYVDDIYVGDIASGIPQVANANMFAVYPNPVTEVAFIRLSAKVSPAAKGELFSVEGKCVKTFDVSYEDEILLDVSTLSPGYYTIKITDGNSGFVQPVIKQ